MKIRSTPWLALAAILCLGHQVAAASPQFSADMVQKAAGETQRMRYFQGAQKMRTEMQAQDGQRAISIIDLKARKMIQLMPDDKMYMELPLGDDTAAWAADDKNREEYYTMKHAGTETVNGYVCDKYILTPKKSGLEKSTTWIAKKLGYPIRTVGQSYSMELTNIKEGAQPASLFTVPKGYQKMPGMDDYRTMMQQQSQGHESAAERGANGAGEQEDISDTIGKGLRGLFGKD